MKALTLLYSVGLTRESVASAVDQTTHSVRLYERGERFPKRQPYTAIVKLAEAKGITLMARDFIVDRPDAA
ncbi:hypothetical protein ACFQZQ_03105 [Lysobacter koreensis]|uniref:XRE family transcriptional regulator n=1 Tax=Lysobacter koreensis TaxID=266122 RepID=A0ABW2YIP6_9GAMM